MRNYDTYAAPTDFTTKSWKKPTLNYLNTIIPPYTLICNLLYMILSNYTQFQNLTLFFAPLHLIPMSYTHFQHPTLVPDPYDTFLVLSTCSQGQPPIFELQHSSPTHTTHFYITVLTHFQYTPPINNQYHSFLSTLTFFSTSHIHFWTLNCVFKPPQLSLTPLHIVSGSFFYNFTIHCGTHGVCFSYI